MSNQLDQLRDKYKPIIREKFAPITQSLPSSYLDNPFLTYGIFETGFLMGMAQVLNEFGKAIEDIKSKK